MKITLLLLGCLLATAGFSVEPTWSLKEGPRALSSATGFDVPVEAITDFGAFTVVAKLTFNHADEHTKFRLFDQTSGETGWSLDIQKSKRVGNFAILGFKGATFVAGDFYARDGETREIVVTARKGLIVVYLDGRVIGRFFADISPASRPLRVGAPFKDGPPEMKGVELLDLKIYGADLEYYAKDEPRGAAAGYRCGRGWRIRVPENATEKLPALLYYGDSISHGYTMPLTLRVGSSMRLYHWSSFLYNPDVNQDAFAEALKTESFDYIIFNNGLHSLHAAWQKSSDEQIRQVYRALVTAFRKGAPRAKLVYLETTPHTASRDAAGKVTGFGDLDFMVQRLNRLADDVMRAEGVTVVPAYSMLAERLDLAAGDGYHWKMPAYGLMVNAMLEAMGVTPTPPAIDVSPTGKIKSALEAHDYIRKGRESGVFQPEERVTVTFAPGDYDVRETLDLGKGDGFVTYRATSRGTVRFSGAAHLAANDFRPVGAAEARRFPAASKDKILVADVSAALPGKIAEWGNDARVPPGPWLYVDGVIRPIARWPNEDPRGGWTNLSCVVDSGLAEPKSPDPTKRVLHAGSFVFDDVRVTQWDFKEGVWLYGYWTHDWFEQILKAKAWTATPTNHVMELAGVHTYGIMGRHTWGAANRRFFALNVPAELDAPGEWWLDRAAKRLYVMPTASWDKADIRLAVLMRPFIRADGARDIRFENIAFEYAHETDFAISVKNSDDVVFDGCDFRNLGGSGIKVEAGHRCQIRRADIGNLGAAAIRITGGDRKTLTRGDHLVEGCSIHHYARFWRTYNPGVGLNGVGQTVRNCVISDAPHNGILYGGNDHLIEGNEICRVVQETSDSGAIYAGRDPTSLGNVIRGNYIHDLGKDPQFLASKWGGYIHGVYLDDCDWGEAIVSNVFARCGGCAIFLCGGNLHETWGNVIVDCANGTGVDSRGRTWQAFSPMFRKPEKYESWWHEAFEKRDFDWRNPPWSTRYPRVAEVLAGEPDLPKICPITNNWFVACAKNHHFDRETPAITNLLPICGNHYYRDTTSALVSGNPWLAACVQRTLKSKAESKPMASVDQSTASNGVTAEEARAGVAILPKKAKLQ